MTSIAEGDWAGVSERRSVAGRDVRALDPFARDVIAMIPMLRGYATMLTGSAAAADDLVQDSLLRALRFKSQFEPGTNLKAWLFRILRNQFLTRMKRERRVSLDGAEDATSHLSTPPDQEWRIRYQELFEGLQQLRREHKEVLLLVAAGSSYQEIAEICDCPVGTVKSRINRARESLVAIMGPVEFALK
jgi:RNA polymerase sigma-70 factor (ECF subfamily)